ncbi:YdeI/OmpD-associated family protein [Actinomycetospora endophytica]|uniref:YdeI/OmpD-associated family protein n=1 Tax=Actinomycetospora endophytica TaxID=2291215 RepID=A0ABS8P1I4_9PSEU|nr:YdeI/OmpD-associated family protein [Actinomycetospora endophytica]MCD2192093.1 YdeI/OmpD-associated family protein [Actinomycetospora endophytica]
MRFRTTVELGGRTATGLPVPDDVAAALDGGGRPAVRITVENGSRAAFDALAYTHRKEWVRWIDEAKKADTRARRVARTVSSLRPAPSES